MESKIFEKFSEETNSHFLSHVLALFPLFKQYNIDLPESQVNTGGIVKNLSELWWVKSAFVYNEIIDHYNLRNSRHFNKAGFLAPIEDEIKAILIATFAVKPLTKIEFAYNKSREINAYAEQISINRYKISINIGLIATLFVITSYLFNEEHSLTNKVSEPTGINAISSINSYTPYLQALKCSPFYIWLPKNDWQILLFYSIVCRALEFIVQHECCHILTGHMEITQDINKGEYKDIALVRQYLESRADDWATFRIVKKWKYLSSMHNFAKRPFILGRGAGIQSNNDLETILAYTFCIIFVTLNLGGHTPEVGEKFGSPIANEHPPLKYRFWRALKLATFDFEIESNGILEDIRDAMVMPDLGYLNCLGDIDDFFSLDKSETDLRNYDAQLTEVDKIFWPIQKELAYKGFKEKEINKIPRPKSFWGWSSNPFPKRQTFWSNFFNLFKR